MNMHTWIIIPLVCAHNQFTQRHVAAVVRLVVGKALGFVFAVQAAAPLGVGQRRCQFIEKIRVLYITCAELKKKLGKQS